LTYEFLKGEVIFVRFISIIVPCYNEEKTIEIFHGEIIKVLKKMDILYEIIYIDDGSKDNTANIIKGLRDKDKSISLISFSKNFGKESAMLAGLDYAKGDAVIIMDADLQHPPNLIPQLIEGWDIEGYDMVFARRKNRKGEPVVRSWLSRLFYKLLGRVCEIELVDGIVDYRIMDRKVVNSIKKMRERHRFSKGLFAWVGYSSKYIEFENVERVAGKTTWNFWKLLDYAIEGIISFTIFPLRVATIIGMVTAIFSFLYMLIVIFDKLLHGNPVSGYASIISLCRSI